MLERVERLEGAVLDPVLVPRDEAAAYASVVRVLAGFVEQMRVAVEPLDDLGAHRGLLAEPDRHSEHEDVGRDHALEDLGPLVRLPAVLGHVGPDTGGDLMFDRPDVLDPDSVASHD